MHVNCKLITNFHVRKPSLLKLKIAVRCCHATINCNDVIGNLNLLKVSPPGYGVWECDRQSGSLPHLTLSESDNWGMCLHAASNILSWKIFSWDSCTGPRGVTPSRGWSWVSVLVCATPSSLVPRDVIIGSNIAMGRRRNSGQY